MKKTLLLLLFVASLSMTCHSVFAQDITINLQPGWNLICYPNATAMGLRDALHGFNPMEGDIIKSQSFSAMYRNGQWRGGLKQFSPGSGYIYYSTRTEATSFVFAHPSSTAIAMTTPTDITGASAVVECLVMLPEGSHVFQRGVCWDTIPNPDVDDNHTTEETGIGGFSSTIDGLLPNTTYYIRAYAVTDYGLDYCEEQSFTTLDSDGSGHESVDLGLPSGLLWATCNVGTDFPEGFGDYYAWGETQTKVNYEWNTYQYCAGSGSTLTKYCDNSSYGYNSFTDSLTTVLPEDDAAMANWGSAWRMPTYEEWDELIDNTTNTWTTQNGVNGWLFTSGNGNSIFLPVASYYDGDSLVDAGIQGRYWSSTLNAGNPNGAWNYSFGPDGQSMYGFDRYCGQSVRAVRSESHNVSFIIHTTTNPLDGGTVTGDGNYEQNQSCTLTASANTGYTFDNWTENGIVVSNDAAYTFTVQADRILVANFIPIWQNGILPGHFSVSATQQVQFSQGNLQCQASTNTWKFAERQYDYVGDANSNVSSTYSGWIDLFGWGTSGYNHGANCYQPWSVSQYFSHYYAYGNSSYNLYDQTGQADWGYNPISNGGNQPNQWRTLTKAEWVYVFNTRNTASGIRFAKAQVNSINGVILLPDDWSTSLYSLSNTNNSSANYSSNTLTVSQWGVLEQAGAVFLPAAGYRRGNSVYSVGSYGDYWSASNCNSSGAYYVLFFDSFLTPQHDSSFSLGFSVRLAHDIQ